MKRNGPIFYGSLFIRSLKSGITPLRGGATNTGSKEFQWIFCLSSLLTILRGAYKIRVR